VRLRALVLVGLAAFVALARAEAPSAGSPPTKPVWVLPAPADASVEHRVFTSAAVGGPVSFEVALPDGFDPASPVRYPVVYWLHGTGGGQGGLRPVSEAFRGAARACLAPPVIVIFPNGLPHHLWSDAVDGGAPVETAFVDDLVAHVDATLPTIPSREARWLEGFSMGGYGAARLGLRHPDRFGVVLALAGGPMDEGFDGSKARSSPELREAVLRDVHGGDLSSFAAQSPIRLARTLGPATAGRTRWLVAAGDQDPGLGQSEALATALQGAGAEVVWRAVPGVGHDAAALLRGLGDAHWAVFRAAASEIAERPRP
jgi:enterochelin esterase-like enzyme